MVQLPEVWEVCNLNELPDPSGRAFTATTCGQDTDIFIIHWQGKVYAYLNRCPHTGVNLNWSDDQFFDFGNRYIQCSMHGALFQPGDGLCIYGPCQGESLVDVPVKLTKGRVQIELKKIRELNTDYRY